MELGQESCFIFFFLILVFWPRGIWDLNSPIKDQTHTLCIGSWSPNHWSPGHPGEVILEIWEADAQQGRPCEDEGRGWNDGATSQERPGPPGAGRGRKDPLLGSAEDARTCCHLESGFLAFASVRGWIRLSKAPDLWQLWPQPQETNTSVTQHRTCPASSELLLRWPSSSSPAQDGTQGCSLTHLPWQQNPQKITCLLAWRDSPPPSTLPCSLGSKEVHSCNFLVPLRRKSRVGTPVPSLKGHRRHLCGRGKYRLVHLQK